MRRRRGTAITTLAQAVLALTLKLLPRRSQNHRIQHPRGPTGWGEFWAGSLGPVSRDQANCPAASISSL